MRRVGSSPRVLSSLRLTLSDSTRPFSTRYRKVAACSVGDDWALVLPTPGDGKKRVYTVTRKSKLIDRDEEFADEESLRRWLRENSFKLLSFPCPESELPPLPPYTQRRDGCRGTLRDLLASAGGPKRVAQLCLDSV